MKHIQYYFNALRKEEKKVIVTAVTKERKKNKLPLTEKKVIATAAVVKKEFIKKTKPLLTQEEEKTKRDKGKKILSDPKLLIDHVTQSLEKGTKQQSKLPIEILELEGMSSAKNRHFLNNVCDLPGANYLEIGIWKGSTFLSSLYDNPLLNQIYGIDNFSEFGNPRTQFFENVKTFIPNQSFTFYDRNCFTLKDEEVKGPIHIYFYDGNHTYESQYMAFSYFDYAFADCFVAIVDDWNEERVKTGTRRAFEKLNYTLLLEQELTSKFNGDKDNWWNGLYVAVIQKPKKS